MAHRYSVTWTAPNCRHGGITMVMANNQREAIKKAKKKLGSKVKKQQLRDFGALRFVRTMTVKITQEDLDRSRM